MDLNENFLFFLHFFTNLWEILGHRDFWVLALKAKVNRWLIKKIDAETSFEEKEKILLKYSVSLHTINPIDNIFYSD